MDLKNSKEFMCISCDDNVSKKTLYINVSTNSGVKRPEVDLNDAILAREMMNPTSLIESYDIPFMTGPIFHRGSDYVIDVLINERFAIDRVKNSKYIQHFVIMVFMNQISLKFDDPAGDKETKQCIGHRLDINPESYRILEHTKRVKHDRIVVNSKVAVIGQEQYQSDGGANVAAEEELYDLYFRPSSKILTCFVRCCKLPSCISFNEDRIVVKDDGDILMDVMLPIFIDLQTPMRYKYDDRSALLRMVFQTSDSSTSAV